MEEKKQKTNIKYDESVKQKANDMFASGKNFDEIAKELGCGKNAVRRWVKKETPETK